MRAVKFDGDWMEVDQDLQRQLIVEGYAMGALKGKDGAITYILSRRINSEKYKTIGEFDSPEELNNILKLLISE